MHNNRKLERDTEMVRSQNTADRSDHELLRKTIFCRISERRQRLDRRRPLDRRETIMEVLEEKRVGHARRLPDERRDSSDRRKVHTD